MVRAPGVQVPPSEAEATRRRLMAEGRLRTDLAVVRGTDGVVFPVTDGADAASYEFVARAERPRAYTDLLDWPDDRKALAPRAFDVLGELVLVKVPKELTDHAPELGQALLDFLPAVRAVFEDRGVTGTYRVRDLHRLAGEGDTRTVVRENGVDLVVDPARAYFSPRLADERARVCGLIQPGDRVIDLFGGVAPFGVQAAKAGADVVSVDLNPDAVALARENADRNGVDVECIQGDAREVGAALAPAHRVVMNLPHGAKEFLDVGAAIVRPGGVLHHHEILADEDVDARRASLVHGLGREARITTVRHVRNYSADESHYVFDVELA